MEGKKCLIELSEALRMIKNSKADCPETTIKGRAIWETAHNCALSCLTNCPPVDAVEVVHGRWIYKDDTVMNWTIKAICSACKCKVAHNSDLAFDYGLEKFEKLHKYCPNCGAKMDGGSNNE